MQTPRLVRRDLVRVGDTIRSSHGYTLLITRVDDSAPVRSDDRHVGLTGHLHGDPANALRTERYPAGSLVEVVARSLPDGSSYGPDHVFSAAADRHAIGAARGGSVPGLHQSRCTCGWRSEPTDETTANEQAEAHLVAAIVERSVRVATAETPVERALRDGGDDLDPEARRLATLDLVRRAAESGGV